MDAMARPGRENTPVIDVHAHAVPHTLIERLRDERPRNERLRNERPGVAVREDADGIHLDIGGRVTPPIGEGLTDPSRRLAAMDRMGVDVQLVSPWMELTPDEIGLHDAARFVRMVNDSLGDLVDHAPSRLRALALLDRRDPASAADELLRCLDTGRFQGAEIGLGGAGPALHEIDWDPFWDAASDTGALVLLHPWRPASPAGVVFSRLTDIVDNPAQSTAAVGAMALAGTLHRFPDLRLCVVHGGGFLPYAAGRFDAIAALEPTSDPEAAVDPGAAVSPATVSGPGAAVSPAAAVPSEYLRRLYFDSLTHSPEALSWLIDFAGADRVMLGSDYPFPTGCADPVRAVTRAAAGERLSGEQVAAVLGTTAHRLLTGA
ncbi:amidohydrolase family protein [Actinomadura sp. 6N118]|uniref:amidohydrolase family protein n=1 Tax=Actinomadura sp. 6N118 TaxID=3375151 RepID=UPI00379F5389